MVNIINKTLNSKESPNNSVFLNRKIESKNWNLTVSILHLEIYKRSKRNQAKSFDSKIRPIFHLIFIAKTTKRAKKE